MSFFRRGNSGVITENDLPPAVKEKLEQIEEIKEQLEGLNPVMGDVDLGTFDN